MDDTEPAADQTIPEGSEPIEDKPEESEFTNQVIEEEAAPEETPVKEEEEEPVALAQETEETPIKEEEEELPIPYQEAEETPVKEEEEEPVAPAQETEETPVKEEVEETPIPYQEAKETPVKEEVEETPIPYQEAEETPVKEEVKETPIPYQEAEETPVKEEVEETPIPYQEAKEETPGKEEEEEHPITSKAVDLSDTALVRSANSNQPADEYLVRKASARKSKERANSYMQTSLTWERKPLAEFLQEKPVPNQVSGVSEKAMKEEEAAPTGAAEIEQHVVQEYFQSAEVFRGKPPQGNGQPATVKESQLPASEPEATVKESQLPASEPKATVKESQLPASEATGAPKPQIENQVSQDNRRSSPDNKIPSLLKLTSDARNEESPVWINPKTGKEMRCSFNQTAQTWEKKPLAEILRASSTNQSWESGNGSALTRSFSQRIHIPYNPEAPEWIGYPNPFEY